MNNGDFFPLERNRYFYGKMLTARDFEIEQRYFNNKRRLINRTIIGAGVVCGLGVYQNDESSFSVETGFALDYLGREIVVSEPIIRNIQTVDGVEQLARSDQAYLCLQYEQEEREPVNSIGAADSESEQFNKISEGFRLFLSTEIPDVSEIYGSAGANTVTTLYCAHGLRIIRVVPRLALAGGELNLRFVILKGIDSRPVSFTYTFESEYFTRNDSEKAVTVPFHESGNGKRDVFFAEYTLRTASVSEMTVSLAKGSGTLSVQMGDYTDRTEVSENPEITLCKSAERLSVLRDTRMSTLEKHIGGENTPICLAKIDCMNIGTSFIIRHITPLPFEQRVSFGGERPAIRAERTSSDVPIGTSAENFLKGGVSADVETLEYWQKPQVSAAYHRGSKSLRFRFGFPSAEAYDYTASSGVTDIPISGAIRVNARFISDEITHDLGIGDVSISVAVEYGESEERRLLFGNGEVFSSRTGSKTVPRIEAAAILSPDKGTFRIGIRLGDYVEGYSVRVRWFAYKPTRDTAVLRAKENIVVRITPDIRKTDPLERVRFTAEVKGTADQSVIWSVADADGGKIDENGLYQAPSMPGTYEIVAASAADAESRASAFVIVGE